MEAAARTRVGVGEGQAGHCSWRSCGLERLNYLAGYVPLPERARY